MLFSSLLIFSCKEEPIDGPVEPNPTPIDTMSTDTTSMDTTFIDTLSADLFVEEVPIIEMNPSGRVPLSAILTFHTSVLASIEVQLNENDFSYSISDLDLIHYLNLYGLVADTDNEVLLIATDQNGLKDSLTFNVPTESLPLWFPEITIHTVNREEMEPGWHLSDFSYHDEGLRTVPFIFDDDGQVRWFLNLSEHEAWSATIQKLENGNFLVGHGWRIAEYDKMGYIINEWFLDGYGQHHEVVEKPNGNFLVSCDKWGLDTYEDHILELDRNDGSIVRAWDLRQVLDVGRTAYIYNTFDWFHNNSVWYSASDDCLVISGRNQGLAKITADNELVWILAPHLGWGNAGPDGDLHNTADYLLTAVNGVTGAYDQDVQDGTTMIQAFEWPWGQHAVMVHPYNGNILVFDNGFNRNFNWGSNYSRAVEYEVNEENMTVRQVWQFGRELGIDFESKIISDVDILPQTGNRLVAPGAMTQPTRRSKIFEVSYPGNNIIFEAEISLNESSGNWGDFDIQYRAERIEL